ncbi:MAG TPA: hypothetical protein VFE47_09790 [Tepidisphaeraceae bacterium]|nr:hypothetical protein [Tepidisphaeraceae bacterium]
MSDVGGQGHAPRDAAAKTSQMQIELHTADVPPTVVQATPVVASAMVPAEAVPAVPLPKALGLSQRKRVALAALAAGAGPGAAARAAGVNAGTLFRWRKYDEHFIAALNTWQAESMKTARQMLATANEEAAAVVLQAIRKGNVNAAMTVLKGLGTLLPQQSGEELAPLVQRELSLEFERLKGSLGKTTPGMRKLKAEKEQEQKRAAEAAAEREARLAEQWERLTRLYLQVPPLPRPVTCSVVEEAVRASAALVRIYATRCTLTIVALTPPGNKERECLIGQLADDLTMTRAQVAARLNSLPWLLKRATPPDESESYARMLESYGATVELRPSWAE